MRYKAKAYTDMDDGENEERKKKRWYMNNGNILNDFTDITLPLLVVWLETQSSSFGFFSLLQTPLSD